ncbi:hypothetical protein GCM10025865_31390 [Paraoerskovia sediminicola]|uniref:Probable peptidoglycan glycosyltransferase FtsW n=1 Tax=Paraoerskovia sediminicola TaxID=1138587 RepID=A0ABN6XGF8_9CELL|nr:hypothetical protein GCM10025865_31390 [Paraoerskovia sediminicola]
MAQGTARVPSRDRGSADRAPGGDERSAGGWRATWDSAVTSYYLIVGSSSILLLFGLVMVLSSSAVTSLVIDGSAFAAFLPQLRFAAIGAVGLVVAARLPVAFYKRGAWWFLLAAIALQSLIFVPSLALSEGGNTNWIHLGPVTLQPSELVKVALAVWLGAVLGRKQRLLGSLSHVLVPGVLGAVAAMGLVMAGNDLGTTMVIFMMVAGAYWVAGVDWRLFAGGSRSPSSVSSPSSWPATPTGPTGSSRRTARARTSRATATRPCTGRGGWRPVGSWASVSVRAGRSGAISPRPTTTTSSRSWARSSASSARCSCWCSTQCWGSA